MGRFSKRQVVKNLLEGKKSEHLLVIPNVLTLSVLSYGYSISEVLGNPEKYCEAVIGYKNKIGYDGFCGGICTSGILSSIAGHLPNSDGVVLGDGEDTIHSEEDLKKLKTYDIKSDYTLKNVAKNIEILREKEPDEPIYVIFSNPAQLSLKLIGENFGYKSLIKNPELLIKVIETVEGYILETAKLLWDLDIDYLWEPVPSFSGYCISRKLYEKYIFKNNQRFNKKLVDYGAKVVIHTCGKYNDRYDLVEQEFGHGWHVSDVDTKQIVDEYGQKVVIIGNLPCISVILNQTPEEIYKSAYKDAIAGGSSGRFILSSDCDISPKTPDENIIAIVKAARDADKELWG